MPVRVNFADGQRVRVIDTESLLAGKIGTVVSSIRVHMAWCEWCAAGESSDVV
jgi:hypothetical protein